MPLSDTDLRYGTVTKTFHWLTAFLILTALALMQATDFFSRDTAEGAQWLTLIFSLHKTTGVAVFFVALLRIVWALTQTKPAPIHPDRRAETFLAETVHWALYASLVIVPLMGWIGHSATEGFSRILWPFGQSLPFVPTSEQVSHLAFTFHGVFAKVLIGALILHVLGALKHALIDRDGTLRRMWFGRSDVAAVPTAERHGASMMAAAGVYVIAAFVALFLAQDAGGEATAATAPETGRGNWTVEDGTLQITIQQMGSAVDGQFAQWSADIEFREEPRDGSNGTVDVAIDISSLTLGAVTDQAMGPAYFNAEAYPTATYAATITPAETGYLASGTMTLAGQEAQVDLPFELTIDGDTARMQGTTTLDRRNFGIGEEQSDESTLGFSVDVAVDLTATRNAD